MLIELSDDQIETILDQIASAMDEYGDDDKSILLCRYLYEKYHIKDAKDGAEKQTSDEWRIINNKEQEEKSRIYLEEQMKLFEVEISRINTTQTMLSKAPVYINENTGQIMKGLLDKDGNVIAYYQLTSNKELNQNST